jgi:hypothetical protein
VKFRDIKDAKDQLDLISNIWVGSYKLRVNLSKFEKGSAKSKTAADLRVEASGPDIRSKALVEAGMSFKTALVEKSGPHRDGKAPVLEDEGNKVDKEVVWEVVIEPDVAAKLNGSFVGFLSEHKEHHVIQQNFLLDGYPNIRIIPLGHLQVLISSVVEGEVKELVEAVGWWCTWFDRFVAWSPELVRNQRVVWLSCFGVPLHA